MNVHILKSKMILKQETNADLAKAMGIHEATLWRKIKGKSQFSQSEISFIVDRYDLSTSEVNDIFFTKGVGKTASKRKGNR